MFKKVAYLQLHISYCGWLVGASKGIVEVNSSLSCYITDQVQVTCICTSWRSVLPTISSIKGVQSWLMLSRDDSTNEKYEKFLISIHERRVVHYLEVSEVLGKEFCHSPTDG